jgi:ABC-type polysaccharide/polyol phosphate export permease
MKGAGGVSAGPAMGTPANLNRGPQWTGDYLFLVQSLVRKDFTVRYRNMSLGMLWSLLNPLVMMGVLWFVFTRIYENTVPHFAVFVMCGLVPYNVFALSWLSGTTSLVENVGLIKRVPVPRELIPISTVLGNCVNMFSQILLLLTIVAFTKGVNIHWLWLLLVWPLEIAFVTGLALIFSALNVYIRDIRYVVESANVVLFWLVPIFYDFSRVPTRYREIYQYNPVAAVVLASRTILLDHAAPTPVLLAKLAASSLFMLAAGLIVFRRLRGGFYNYL